MPIFFRPSQSIVQCKGDIISTVGTCGDDGEKEWYIKLKQSFCGEVGRDVQPGEFDDNRPLRDQPGVFILAKDPRSIGIIISTLERMKKLMVEEDEKGE